jgi:hypothetical protein
VAARVPLAIMQNLVPSGSNSLQPSWQSCNVSRAWLLNHRIYLCDFASHCCLLFGHLNLTFQLSLFVYLRFYIESYQWRIQDANSRVHL